MNRWEAAKRAIGLVVGGVVVNEQFADNPKINTDPNICDVCGVNMKEDGVAIKGISLFLDKSTHKSVENVKKMFGKLEHNICWCCWLKSLGVRPII